MDPIEAFPAKVDRCLARYRLDRSGWVLAVSGGPDSVALLRAFFQLYKRAVDLGLRQLTTPIVVAHLNHSLRGSESDSDEAFVAQLCEEMRCRDAAALKFCCKRIDVAGLACRARENIESTARKVRYAWFAEVARLSGVGQVATGHTIDDQAETVFHNLLRGSGLRGLRGIAPRRKLEGNLVLARPLLDVSREEVLAYLGALGQDYRVDSSNADLRLTRNRIRRELLPYLVEHGYPKITGALTRVAEQARAVYAETRSRARTFLKETELPRAGVLVVLDRAKLATKPRTWVREIFRQTWLREGWPRAAMGYREWDRLAELVFGGELSALDLPGGIRARRRPRVVQVGPVP